MEHNGERERLIAEYRAKTAPLGVMVWQGSAEQLAGHVAAWEAMAGLSEVPVALELRELYPAFCTALEGHGIVLVDPVSPEQMRNAPIGISVARLAVAETGSPLLAEETLADRSISLLPRAQAIVCRISDLVASLDEAGVVLREMALAPGRNMTTLVTGPSRTADIERVLTVGVQGPGQVVVLFVDEENGKEVAT